MRMLHNEHTYRKERGMSSFINVLIFLIISLLSSPFFLPSSSSLSPSSPPLDPPEDLSVFTRVSYAEQSGGSGPCLSPEFLSSHSITPIKDRSLSPIVIESDPWVGH